MGKGSYKKLKGSQNFRQRLILATLSATPIIIKGIRANDMLPGLRLHEVSLLRLLEKISDDCVVKINETGTMVQYKPGILMGGRHLVHDCGEIRAIGYFLEPLLVLGLFSKNPLSIRLKVTWIDEGMVKRIRGVTFSTRVSSQFENTMIHSARGIFNHLLPDVHIFTDHKAGPQAGNSPGYGISLVAETTSGCFISANTAVSYARAEDGGMEDEKGELMPPEDVGEQIASVLLQEIEQGGVVDTTHQGLLFLLCALCPQDVSKIRVGKLIPHGIEVLKLIRDFLGVKFVIKPDPSTGTVILKCVGSGLKNLSRKSS
ncbi:RNA 3'-terminal phosphate cyclase-like protein [Populus alba x Populus x berolinensis]|uniref:RNA 3'-terminal phosphate cyclase-like protein n=1 Tax=Populus alba x Populus x berolinensis TaxID=444605 RepID=A0AAD6RNJ1_9ROSI|nr:RNA 3'-terminal phosphate cyclase-like protein [Populus alba x Populus x berolinensis]